MLNDNALINSEAVFYFSRFLFLLIALPLSSYFPDCHISMHFTCQIALLWGEFLPKGRGASLQCCTPTQDWAKVPWNRRRGCSSTSWSRKKKMALQLARGKNLPYWGPGLVKKPKYLEEFKWAAVETFGRGSLPSCLFPGFLTIRPYHSTAILNTYQLCSYATHFSKEIKRCEVTYVYKNTIVKPNTLYNAQFRVDAGRHLLGVCEWINCFRCRQTKKKKKMLKEIWPEIELEIETLTFDHVLWS